MRVATKKQMADLEGLAVERLGISTLILMENAAVAVARRCMDFFKDDPCPKAFIAAGQGNNGGDGLAVARHLSMGGVDVRVVFIGDEDKSSDNTRFNLNIVRNMRIPIVNVPVEGDCPDLRPMLDQCGLVVDAILGFGVTSNLQGAFARVADMINGSGRPVIAIDIPSGVNPDTGRIMGTAVKANVTVTLGAAKSGLYLHPACEYAGEVVLASICIPPFLTDYVPMERCILTAAEAAALLPERPLRSNKGTFGRVLALAGCDEMPGAATLAANAAYKAGCGLVKACVTRHVAGVVQNGCREATTRILPDKNGFLYGDSAEAVKDDLINSNGIILGSGLGANEMTAGFVSAVIQGARAPLVIDADALNVLSANPDLLKSVAAPAAVTPHPGEMSRLTGMTVEDILRDTIGAATDFAKEYNVTTVLKDARTIVASPGGKVYINTTGSPAMAKAGSGDVLTGLIAGFAAQGMDMFEAAMLSCFIHGEAGRTAAEKLGVHSVNASDTLDCLPGVLLGLSQMKGR